MKRQRSRNRGGGGGGGGGGGKPQHNANRAFDSNGPEGVKVRGAAQHVYEKYQQLARDAGSAGDRVLAENYQQHAEHYFRLIRAMQPMRPIGEIIGRETFASGYDIDFEDESGQNGEAVETAEAEGGDGDVRQGQWARDDRGQGGQQNQPRDDRGQRDDYRQRDDFRAQNDRPRDDYRAQNDRPRDDRPRDDRPRDDRPRDDRPRDRDDRPRDDRPRDDFRPRDDRQGGGQQGGGQQGGGRERFNRDQPRYRDDRQRDQPRVERDPLGVVEPQAAAPLAAQPSYEPPEEPRGGVLRSDDGVSHAPAFLQTRAEPRPESEDQPIAPARPRRRKPPRTFDADSPGAAPTDADEG
ncbi:MAG: DUF4167 domain-containing protein [Caulobacterales bacterium]